MDEIVSYYEKSEEAERLHGGSGLLERVRTQDILRRYLPAAPARILDVGGGPGEYSGWLTSLGYEVYLLDPVEKHLEQARRLPLAGVQQGDARALPAEAGVADAVLLMGPLYHLTLREDRMKALGEAWRVMRPGGVLCAAVISRYASLLHSLVDGFVDDDLFWPVLERDLQEGQHRNDTSELKYFTTAVFHKPGEIEAELREAGFGEVEVLAVEGPGWLAKDFDEHWQDEAWRERLLSLVARVEREDTLIGCSMHLIAIGRKLS